MTSITLNGTSVHKHDCSHCIFLGSFTDGDDVYDLYMCNQISGITVIARYGSGPMYISGWTFGYRDRDDESSAIGEAYRRAIVLMN